jgi:hypothetical protein
MATVVVAYLLNMKEIAFDKIVGVCYKTFFKNKMERPSLLKACGRVNYKVFRISKMTH